MIGGHLSNLVDTLFWSAFARSYDNLARHFQPYKDLVQEVCDHVDRYADGRCLRVLDAGCGTGNYSWELTKRGHQVVGVDLSPVMLKRAEAKRVSPSAYPQFMQHDLSVPLPFADDEFDAVVSVNVLFAMTDARAALSSASRVAKSGGLLVVTTAADQPAVSTVFRDAIGRQGLLRGVRSLLPLVPVGVFNWAIDRRLGHGYVAHDERGLVADLEASGWIVQHTAKTYVGHGDLLAVAVSAE